MSPSLARHAHPATPSIAPAAAGAAVGGMLLSRTALFTIGQLIVATLLLAGGSTTPLADSAAWWPLVATAANVVCIALLVWLLRREGSSLVALYRVERATVARDLLLTLGVLVGAAVLVVIPNIALGVLLFGDPLAPVGLMFRPLPPWAVLVSLTLFPLTIGLAELPTYFGYVLPRLSGLIGRPWLALVLTAFWLAAQHAALPIVLDWRFVIWRLGMFLPFALFTGFVLWRRPRLLPYLMVIHVLIDFQAALMVPVAQP